MRIKQEPVQDGASPPDDVPPQAQEDSESKTVPAKEEVLKTPAQWAEELGPKERALYASADYLHGWSEHAYHYQAEPQTMTRETFGAALEAAGKFPTCPPHGPALGKTVEKNFEGFKALAAKQPKKEAK
jgi:hypothetical protein